MREPNAEQQERERFERLLELLGATRSATVLSFIGPIPLLLVARHWS